MAKIQKQVIYVLFLTMAIFVASTCYANATEKVNINTASIEQLMQLDRVGAKYAKRIVEYREEKGDFQKPEEIMNVKGIGKKTWEANKDRIVI